MVRIIFDYKLDSVKIYTNAKFIAIFGAGGYYSRNRRNGEGFFWLILIDLVTLARSIFFRPNRKKERKKRGLAAELVAELGKLGKLGERKREKVNQLESGKEKSFEEKQAGRGRKR